MKNVSKLALFVAAGMVSAGVNAATIQIPEGTAFELEGEFVSNYFVKDAVDTAVDTTDGGDPEETNENDLEGEIELAWSAVRSFENFDGYTEAAFKFENQTNDGTGTEFDGAVAGIEGDFGQLEVGATDSVYEDLITDAVDITEESGLDYGGYGFDENNMLTYYSPETAGFSFNLQIGILDEAENSTESEQGFVASAAYDFGVGAIHVGYDELGNTADSDDGLTGIATVFELGLAEVSLSHEMETDTNDQDTDYTGLAVSYDYGMGNLYGAYQSVSPDVGNDQSQYALGVSAAIADGFDVYAEYADFDGQDPTDADTQMTLGLVYAF
ncbi:UNVERIFIED_CONTAM: porin [Spiribacter pallidus]